MSEFWRNVIIQGIGFLGLFCAVVAFQCKSHKKIMVFRTLNEVFFAVQYGVIGAYTGLAMNVLGSARNVVFAEMVKRDKNTVPMRFVFSAVYVVFIVLTWAGVKSVLSGFAKVLSTFAYGSKNLIFMRFMIIITSGCWLVYNLFVGSYAGVISEAFTIVSLIVGIIRFKPERKKEDGEETIVIEGEELTANVESEAKTDVTEA